MAHVFNNFPKPNGCLHISIVAFTKFMTCMDSPYWRDNVHRSFRITKVKLSHDKRCSMRNRDITYSRKQLSPKSISGPLCHNLFNYWRGTYDIHDKIDIVQKWDLYQIWLRFVDGWLWVSDQLQVRPWISSWYIKKTGIASVFLLKGQVRSWSNLISEDRVNISEQNSENLMKIGWKIRKLWHFEVSQIFRKHFLTSRYEYANEWVDDVIASLLAIYFVHNFFFPQKKLLIVCPPYQDILVLTLFCIYSESN